MLARGTHQKQMPDRNPIPEPDPPGHGDYELQDCLDALAALGDEQRYRILSTLQSTGESSASGLREQVGAQSAGFHYHLERLADAGLVTNRKEDRQTASGVHSYYEVSDLGEALLRTVGHLAGTEEMEVESAGQRRDGGGS